MSVYQLAVTYEPKIEPVFSKECRRSLRFSTKYKEGDVLIIHDWSGRPYGSKWKRRLYAQVIEVIKVTVHEKGIAVHEEGGPVRILTWRDPEVAEMARLDGIKAAPGDDRPLGVIWFEVLSRLNKATRKKDRADFKEGAVGSIIIWGFFD